MEEKKKLRLKYNAPVVLTFLIISFIMLVINQLTLGAINNIFMTYPNASLLSPLTYIRLFTHVICHSGWEHFFNNMMLFVLIGPLLEEKYGSKKLLMMILITSAITSIINAFLFNTALLGASGIVFMFVLLSSFTAFKEKEIPITFILVLMMYLGQEIISGIISQDDVSQFAHILGGLCGSVFGFIQKK